MQVTPPKRHRVESAFTTNHGHVKHEFDNYGHHRLVVNDREGAWASYTSLAEFENYRGTTAYFDGSLPEVFKISPLKETP